MAIILPVAAKSSPLANIPLLPKPLINEGYPASQTEYVAHPGTLIDGVVFESNLSIRGRLKNANVWQVINTAIHANVDAIICQGITNWYDSINDRLYIFGIDIGTSPATLYTAYIVLETGSLFNVGNDQLTANLAPAPTPAIGDFHVTRVAEDSGNFTLSSTDQTIVINSTTGAEVSHTVEDNSTENQKLGHYLTEDGTVFLSTIVEGHQTPLGTVLVTKSDVSTTVPMLRANFTGGAETIAIKLYALLWGDKVKIINTTNSSIPWLKTFKRSEFDAWVKEVVARGGL